MGAVCLLTVALIGAPAAPALADSTAEEAPPPESVEETQPSLERQRREATGDVERLPALLDGIRDKLRGLPAFAEETRLRLTLRSFYLYGKLKNNERREAWAYGGSAFYESGWISERLALGAEFFTSQPIHAPSDRDGTSLLRPRQRQYSVFGQTYAKLRLGEGQVATLYRQFYELPYVNKQYNRMTPNSFEGYSLQGGFGGEPDSPRFVYVAGYISKIKPRNSQRFVPMGAVAAPVAEPKRGTWMAGGHWAPSERFSIGVINYYTRDVLNIFYAETQRVWTTPRGLAIRGTLQFTDQRSVNDDLITGSSFDTRTAAAQLSASWNAAILRVALQTTSSEAPILAPWGLAPTPLWSMLGAGFQRADEEAWLVGLSYVFSRIGIEGLSTSLHYARGLGARSEVTGDSLSDQGEFNVTVDYRLQQGPLRGLWLRVRGAFLNEEGGGDSQNELRLILNYDLPIL